MLHSRPVPSWPEVTHLELYLRTHRPTCWSVFSLCGMFSRKDMMVVLERANHRRANRFNVRQWLERMRKRHSHIRERASSTQRSQQDTFGERYLIRGVCSKADSRPKRKMKVEATRCAFAFDSLQFDQIRIVGIPCQVSESLCESRTGDCLAILGRYKKLCSSSPPKMSGIVQ